MSVLLPTSARNGSTVRPVTQRRKFRLSLQCLECGHEHPLEMTLLDEPHDPATKDDFYESGVMDRVEFTCERCGCGQASYDEVRFVPSPVDRVDERG